MLPLECYNSRLKLLGLLGLTAALVALCGFVATLPDLKARVVGAFGVAFFALGFVVIPFRMGSFGPQVILNDEGIEDVRLGAGPIGWGEIRAARIASTHGQRFLCLDLRNPGPLMARLSPWKRRLAGINRAMGFGDVTVSFAGLTPGLDAALDHIRARSEGASADA